jgi:hypothetical protein
MRITKKREAAGVSADQDLSQPILIARKQLKINESPVKKLIQKFEEKNG